MGDREENAKRAQLLRENIPPVEVLRYLDVQVRGPKIRCLWHREDEPSLQIYPDHLHCYGKCRRGYDIVNIVEVRLNLSFADALDWLEEVYGRQEGEPLQIRKPKTDDPLWAAAERTLVEALRPFILKPGKAVYQAIEDDIWRCYTVWDEIVVGAKEVGESPTKTVQRLIPRFREHLLKKVEGAVRS